MADRQTRIIGGNGTATQAFTLDPGLLQYVQSVFVTVDNSAGGDIQPTLTVQTNNGQDFAKKQQGRSIPAGDSGSATWALRLDDESASTPTGAGDVQLLWEYTVPAGGQQIVDTNVDGPLAGPLSQLFNVLEVFASMRGSVAAISQGLLITFNVDAGATYDQETTDVQSNAPVTALSNTYNQHGISNAILGSTAPAARPSSLVMAIPNYASTLLHKTGTAQYRHPGGSGGAGINSVLWQWGFNWHPAAVAGINRLTFATSLADVFVEGSFFAVYGRR